jgi:tyrosinase
MSTPVQPLQHHHTLVLMKTLVSILTQSPYKPTLILIALHPFHRNTAGDFWTSATVRDHTVFGSTYPEFLGLSATNTLAARVNALYGPNATSQFSWETARIDQHTASPQSGDVQYQYFAIIRAQHTGPGGVAKVFVFLGGDMSVNTESPDPLQWMADPRFVGYTGFQGAAGQEMEMQTNGVVALTKALEDHMRKSCCRSLLAGKAVLEACWCKSSTWQTSQLAPHKTNLA